jgi:hypothetical protein
MMYLGEGKLGYYLEGEGLSLSVKPNKVIV